MKTTKGKASHVSIDDLRSWLKWHDVDLEQVKHVEIVSVRGVPTEGRVHGGSVYIRVERYVVDGNGQRFAVREGKDHVLAMEQLFIPLKNLPGETTHACPRSGDGFVPCCLRTPLELPRGARITEELSLVTCGRR